MSKPLRAAAIDIGSNGMRLIVADAEGPGGFHVVHSERAAVRLGHHTFTEGHLDPATVDDAVEALAGFQATIKSLGAHRLRAVATSAVRDAEDAKDFIRKVRRRTGLRVEPIEGTEEARLIHRAVAGRIPWGERPWLMMDLGGGSLEIALIDRHRIHWSESRSIGTVRLLEKHARDAEGPLLAERIHAEVDAFQMLHSTEGLQVGGVAATGGNINALARLDSHEPRKEDPAVLSLEQLTHLRQELESLSVEQRMEAHGFRSDRADVIVPAALVYERVTYLSGADAVHVPGWGLREGVILDLMDAHFGKRAADEPRDEAIDEACLELGRTFHFDEDHAQHVAHLALRLFDDLAGVHRLKPADRQVLHVAAMLHDVGAAIGVKGHHKHSQYIIEHAALGGLSEKQIQMAATVARYHRKALPQEHHHLYRLFGGSTRRRVDRMAAILRVANALDEHRLQDVVDVHAERRGAIVGISLDARGSAVAAREAALAEAALWRKTLGDLTIDAP